MNERKITNTQHDDGSYLTMGDDGRVRVHQPISAESADDYTADGVKIVPGLRVWNNNLQRAVVVAAQSYRNPNESQWYDMATVDGRVVADDGRFTHDDAPPPHGRASMSASRRLYVQIADVIKSEREQFADDLSVQNALDSITNELCVVLKRDNAAFKPETFRRYAARD